MNVVNIVPGHGARWMIYDTPILNGMVYPDTTARRLRSRGIGLFRHPTDQIQMVSYIIWRLHYEQNTETDIQTGNVACNSSVHIIMLVEV